MSITYIAKGKAYRQVEADMGNGDPCVGCAFLDDEDLCLLSPDCVITLAGAGVFVDSGITTHEGQLFVRGIPIPAPYADRVAAEFGCVNAEEMVAKLTLHEFQWQGKWYRAERTTGHTCVSCAFDPDIKGNEDMPCARMPNRPKCIKFDGSESLIFKEVEV